MTRSLAAKLILIVGLLTTIATSAPEDYYDVSDVGHQTIGPGATRVAVLASRAAVIHGDRVTLSLQLVAAGGGAPVSVTVIPDDARYPAEQFQVGASQVLSGHDLTALCPRDRDCDAGATIEVESDALVEVTAVGVVSRKNDEDLLFPDNPPFPDDATVEIRFQQGQL